MADFLARLIDRARGDAPVLVRRAAHRFEPSASPASSPELSSARTWAERDALDADGGPRSPMSSAEASVTTFTRASALRASEREIDAHDVPRAASSEGTIRRDPVAAEPVGEPPARGTRRVVASLEDAAAFVTSPVPQSRGPAATFAEAPAARRRTSELEHEPSPIDAVGRRHTRASAAISQPPRLPDAHHAATSPVAPIAGRVPAAATTPSSNPTAAAPTIHVTIGRVEVRAVPAPPPARSAGPTAPRLSLDAYLRARAGERP
jgi:hypothetical protein